jgi:hypothetical protein
MALCGQGISNSFGFYGSWEPGYSLDEWSLIPRRAGFFFATMSRLALEPNQPFIQWVLGFFPQA